MTAIKSELKCQRNLTRTSRSQIRNANTRLPCRILEQNIMSTAITFTLSHYFEPTQRHCGQVEIRFCSRRQPQTNPYCFQGISRNIKCPNALNATESAIQQLGNLVFPRVYPSIPQFFHFSVLNFCHSILFRISGFGFRV